MENRTKKFLIGLSLFCFCLMPFSKVQAEINPKAKALGLMATYGAVGGALLGTATLAFGTDGRSVAKGASLGLYAGLIFGSYVVLSHAYRKNKAENPEPSKDYYPDTSKSPYEEESGGSSWFDFGGGGTEEEGEVAPDQRLNILFEQESQSLRRPIRAFNSKVYKTRPIYFVPLFHYQF